MDRRHNGSSYGTDSNFTDILNRTRQNISRISSRYSTDAVDQPAYSISRSTTSFREPIDLDKYSSPMAVNRSLIGYQQKVDSDATENRPPPVPSRNDKVATSLDDIMERLSKLEQGAQDRYRFEERMMKVESSLESLRAAVDSLVIDMREEKREVSKLSNQLSSQSTTLEILQHDVDSRRR